MQAIPYIRIIRVGGSWCNVIRLPPQPLTPSGPSSINRIFLVY